MRSEKINPMFIPISTLPGVGPKTEVLFNRLVGDKLVHLLWHIPYNLLKRDLELSVLPYCKKYKIGVLIYGVLGRGVLTNKYIQNNDWDKNSRANKNQKIKNDLIVSVSNLLKELSRFSCKQRWADVSQLVIAWALSQEGITSAILGSRTVGQLKSNLQAVDIQLKKDELLLVDRLVGNLGQYMGASLGHPGKIFLQ